MIGGDHVGDGIGDLIEKLRFQMNDAGIPRQEKAAIESGRVGQPIAIDCCRGVGLSGHP